VIKAFFYPIRSRLILSLVISLLPLVVAMIVISLAGSRVQLNRANEATQSFAIIAADHQKQLLSDLKQLVTILAEDSEIHANPTACSRSLTKIMATIPNYNTIALTDRNGVIICGPSNSLGKTVAQEDYFQQAHQTLQFTLSHLVTSQFSDKPVIFGAMPWADESGDFAGMAIASIETNRFADSFKDLMLPAGSKYFLFDAKANLITSQGAFTETLHRHVDALPLVTSMVTPFVVRENDQPRTYTTLTIENGALTVLIGIPRHTFLNFSFDSLLVSLLGPITLLVVVVVCVWLVGDRLVTAPVTSLIRTARSYSRGDLTVRPQPVKTGGELRELSTTFAEMADRIAKREQELQDAITKRELMLREIHHRVKNNLQIVISLVNLQSKSVTAPDAQSAFTEIQTRMRALALVHRYLYESDDLQSVNIGAFLAELCNSLQIAYGVSPTRVALEVTTEPVWDISDRAIPLALFMTETISNALRHAFPENRPGHIKVSLKNIEDHKAQYSIEDNGIGLEAQETGSGQVPKTLTGLGMSLTKAFARQVDGELKISGPPGTQITLQFTPRKPTPI
jgi:two-component sensor histidine kinase